MGFAVLCQQQDAKGQELVKVNKMIKLIVSKSTNPYYNLAIEEWAVRNIDTSKCDYLFLYENTECVVVGRNQNVFQEVNLKYCKENNIRISRRVSGGGTVFHDLENLNWTFITGFDNKKVNNYAHFAQPIIATLETFGVEAYLNKRNAIMVGQTKVSGQAQFTNRSNILSHGTLLIGSDTTKLQESITLRNKKVTSKASPSVNSVVKNLKEICTEEISIEIFKNALLKNCDIQEVFSIENLAIKKKIKEIETTYQTNKWIYERSSKCVIEEEIKGEWFQFEIIDAKVKAIKNKKGEEINQHPFLNKLYFQL